MSSSTHRIAEGQLLGRLSRARDLPEALTVLLGTLRDTEGLDRALVLVASRDELRGASGIGWDEERARRVAAPLTDLRHPLVGAYLSAVPTSVRLDAHTGLDPGSYRVLPIPGCEPERPGCGLVLLGPGPAGRADSAVEELLEEVGPLLERLAELDHLRRGVRERDLLTSILDTLSDPVLITDAANGVIFKNRRSEQLFTSREDDNEGRRHAVEINHLLFSSFLTRMATGVDAGSRELNLVDPVEGGDLLFEVLSTPLPAGPMEGSARISVLRDVTDLKRATTELERQFKRLRHAEQKSRRERDRLNLILENVGDPILVTDDQSNIILMNREAERLFEIPPGTDETDRISQDIRANDTRFSSFISDFALSPDGTRVAEFMLSEPETGREFLAEVVSGKVLNERAEMSAIVSVVHDLTKAVENERMAAELSRLNENLEERIQAATEALEERNRQLEWQSQELERAYRLKSQFLASMSHELRTPINALLGYTSLMLDQIYGDLNQRQCEALNRMYTASQHLLELVNDILDLAKIEAGKMPVHLEPVKIDTLVHELSQTIEPMIRRKDLEYSVELEDGLPTLETDRTKVKQIVLNLLSNAVKFTHQGRVSLRVRSAQERDGIVIEVEDSGIGIAEEDLPKIFEDFRQVDQSSTREYGGTGLGLSITKKLLHLLGGVIRVTSVPGAGSTFTVWLPRRSEEILLDEQAARLAREANQAVTTRELV